jgi:hypothetical protein
MPFFHSKAAAGDADWNLISAGGRRTSFPFMNTIVTLTTFALFVIKFCANPQWTVTEGFVPKERSNILKILYGTELHAQKNEQSLVN